MIKAVSRNTRGVDFDAQAAAREAARREGKSLGEWLHDVIADHAADIGVGQGDVVGQDRVDAVTSRLERLSTRTAQPSRRSGYSSQAAARDGASAQVRPSGSDAGRPLSRFQDSRDDDGAPAPARRSRYSAERIYSAERVDDPESLLEDAVDLMERRTARSERRTDEALAGFAKMMETNEARRAQEHQNVTALTQKLASLETKLTQQFAAGDNPVKGALARLEARLDLISKRNAAEVDARFSALKADRSVSEVPEAVQRLEEKLNSVLQAVQGRPARAAAEVSDLALRAAQTSDIAPARRSLGEAIAEISRRQQSLEETGWSGRHEAAAKSGAVPLRAHARTAFHERASTTRGETGAEGGIADLIAKIDDMRRDLAASREVRRSMRGADLDVLRGEIAAMSQTLQDIMPRGAVSALEDSVQILAKRLESGEATAAARSHYDAESEIVAQQKIDNLEYEVRAIAEKIDSLTSNGADRLAAEMLQDQMKELADTAASLRAMMTAAPDVRALEKIEHRLEDLAGKVDEARFSATPPAPAAKIDTSILESLVRELGDKIEAVQAPGSDTNAIEGLQHQIARLSERFERSEQGLATLPTLAASVRELFNQLETTRASVETSAAHAAREVLRIAADDGRGRVPGAAAARDIAVLKSHQDVADQRTRATLNSVHDVLEQVVDRLSSVESEIAVVRKQPAAASSSMSSVPAPVPAPAPAPTLAQRPVVQRPAAPKAVSVADLAGTKDFGLAGLDMARESLVPPKVPKRAEPIPASDADDTARHANFIAAARRAATTAQAEVSVAALRRPPGTTPADKAARADMLAKSRDYVSTNKRPMLMGLAAILMVLGTIALLQRTNLAGGLDIAAKDPPARISTAAIQSVPAAKNPPLVASNELSPSALPKAATPLANPIPGSDPIQTGSIPSLPSFAARAPVAADPQTTLPPGLKLAAEAGNGDAEYELGARYSEGRAVPRDLKLAAQWLAKAADQGLAPAQYRLASLYEKGLGVAQDKAKAKSLYALSADSGNPRAMHNLAVMLADGDGRPDYTGAATWFRKAAAYGVHDSQYNLAILLARGLGVQQSLVQSYQWFAIAAQKDDTDAARKRDEVGAKMNPNDLAIAKALATSFQAKTANATAVEIEPPSGGWDGAPSSSHLNSAKSKISSL